MKRCFYLPICLFFTLMLNQLNAQTTDSIPDTKPSDWDVAVEAVQLAGEARMMRDSFSETATTMTDKRVSLERELRRAEADSTTAADVLKNLRSDLKNAQKQEKEAQKNLKRSEETLSFAEEVANMDSRQQKAQIAKSRKQVQQLKNILHPAPPPAKKEKTPKKEEKPEEPAMSETPQISPPDTTTATPVTPEAEKAEKRRAKTKPATTEPKPIIRPYSAAEDVLINPPSPPCVLASTVRDEFSGEIRKEMPQKELFRYTNQALRKQYSAEKPHTIAEAFLLSYGLNAALHMTFKIQDLNVRRTQGSLQKGGTATLKFMDGTSIILYDSRSDEGVTDAEGQSVIYQAQFPIDRTTIRKLRSTELDRIRIAWSNGMEDYDVQQVDQLMWQAKCLFE